MTFTVVTDEGAGRAVLTDEHAASSYGLPVLVIEAQDVSGVFGPADAIGGTSITAARIVLGWARRPGRTPEERDAAALFLQQWPEGPQLSRCPAGAMMLKSA